MPKLDRRRFLTALGLGAGSLYLPSVIGRGSRAAAQAAPPTRIAFFITPHGMVPPTWQMRDPGSLATDHELDLRGLAESDFSRTFQPLHSLRDKLLILDNLTMATSIAESKRVRNGNGHDGNEHHLGQAHLLTSTWSVQRSGSTAIGGGRSLDLTIGDAVGVPGRFANRIYGFRHQHPYSFAAANEPAPREESPSAAFRDLMGFLPSGPSEPSEPAPPTRAERLRAARGSVLDFAAGEFERTAPRLSREDRQKLERHRQLIRDLELSFGGPGGGSGPVGRACDPNVTLEGNALRQFARLTALAFSCDVTRVVTYVTGHLQNADFGAPSHLNMHQDIAHNSTSDAGGYSPTMAEHMTNYNRAYAAQFATFLQELDSVPEGDGTLLDHTVVVWCTELSTGTHWRDRMPRVLAGGAGGYFRTGRYVYYAPTNVSPFSWGRPTDVGPAESHLHVSLMHAMGMRDRDSFGLSQIEDHNGATISLRGPLPRLT
ncbi:MAG: DUF1552 domain-containing protein [Myxococcales bacterium]|nr:DUF1552 domain-containing protein [Myxococcales bacterium]